MSAFVIKGVTGTVDATVSVPGSKSVANRALVCAALAVGDGVSRIGNVPDGDDCDAMLMALGMSGALADGAVRAGIFPGTATSLDAAIAGTTSRFLTAAAALSTIGVVVDGGAPLRARPMTDLHDALRGLGAVVESLGAPGHLPVRVARGNMTGGEVTIRGDVSSQFTSALMLLAPRLEKGLSVRIDGPLVSRPYVEMTASVMRAFGAVVTTGDSLIRIEPAPYSPTDYEVEPDFSSAAFPIMAMAFREGTLMLPGLARATMQGDSRILDIARQMGMTVDVNGDDIRVTRGAGSLQPVSLDLADSSDLVPAVATACTVAAGTSEITGVGFIRAKESDRLGDFATEAARFGARVEVLEDGLRIHGGRPVPPREALDVHHDHRLAMSFALLCGTGHDVTLSDPETVGKSWRGFFGDMGPLLGEAGPVN